MSVTSELIEDNDLFIEINGVFNFEVLKEFRAAYVGKSVKRCVIDFRAIKYIDSSGLEMLLSLRRELGNIEVKIINCRPQAKKVLQISHFEKMFAIE